MVGRTLQSLRTLPLQELLRHIEELSRELYRLKGGCESSSSLRIRKFPAGARPSPISCGVIQVRALRHSGLRHSGCPLECHHWHVMQAVQAAATGSLASDTHRANTACLNRGGSTVPHFCHRQPETCRHHNDVTYICTADSAGATMDTLDPESVIQ